MWTWKNAAYKNDWGRRNEDIQGSGNCRLALRADGFNRERQKQRKKEAPQDKTRNPHPSFRNKALRVFSLFLKRRQLGLVRALRLPFEGGPSCEATTHAAAHSTKQSGCWQAPKEKPRSAERRPGLTAGVMLMPSGFAKKRSSSPVR
ncbi:MAG: hypothetical protein Q7S97_09425 [Polaromonas sp.]|nr:hypothetical protein [Burkholderiales bacterium]MDO8441402.1 hypothetical protein [Polaromonas sp.]